MVSQQEIQDVLRNFVDDLHSQIQPDTHRFEDILQGRDSLKEIDVGSRPEPWTRKHLIRPLLNVVELAWEPEIHGGGEGYPDFGVTNLEIPVIGEDKRLNGIEEAEDDVKEYLNNRAASRGAEYAIATDGFEWKIYRIELGGDYLNYSIVRSINLRHAILQVADEKGYIEQTTIGETDVEQTLEQFIDIFARDNLNTLLTQEAPNEFRAEKQAGVEEFYDLYVELLFGEGERDYGYDTTLLNDIRAPAEATETERRKFAIKLVNRLLFVKFLEDREVLPSSFLNQRVENYQQAMDEVDEFGGGLYKTQLEPLFFSLFNTEEDERISKHRGSWFDDVPYLNGSLFAPDEHERESFVLA